MYYTWSAYVYQDVIFLQLAERFEIQRNDYLKTKRDSSNEILKMCLKDYTA